MSRKVKRNQRMIFRVVHWGYLHRGYSATNLLQYVWIIAFMNKANRLLNMQQGHDAKIKLLQTLLLVLNNILLLCIKATKERSDIKVRIYWKHQRQNMFCFLVYYSFSFLFLFFFTTRLYFFSFKSAFQNKENFSSLPET